MTGLLASNLVNGLLVFIIGLLVVFLGIALIVIVISIIGKIFATKKEPKVEKEEPAIEPVVQIPQTPQTSGVTPQEVAAITAVLTAYFMSGDQNNCEFKIKKIKRIF